MRVVRALILGLVFALGSSVCFGQVKISSSGRGSGPNLARAIWVGPEMMFEHPTNGNPQGQQLQAKVNLAALFEMRFTNRSGFKFALGSRNKSYKGVSGVDNGRPTRNLYIHLFAGYKFYWKYMNFTVGPSYDFMYSSDQDMDKLPWSEKGVLGMKLQISHNISLYREMLYLEPTIQFNPGINNSPQYWIGGGIAIKVRL